jgi:hypothetical protein
MTALSVTPAILYFTPGVNALITHWVKGMPMTEPAEKL